MKRKKGFIFLGIMIAILAIGILGVRYYNINKAKKIEQCVLQRIEDNVYEDDAELKKDVKDIKVMQEETSGLCGNCGNNCHLLCDDVWEAIEDIKKNTQEMREIKKFLEAKLHCYRENGYSNYELRQLGFSSREIYGL